MSGLLGGGNDITNSEQRIGALQVQQSSQGLPIALMYGRNRVAPNLLWFGDFEAIENRDEQEAGKGGGTTVTNISYTYRASLLLGLCAGVCTGISRIWRTKERITDTVVAMPSDQLTHVATVAVGKQVTVPQAARYDSTIAVYVRLGIDAGFGLTPTSDYTVLGGVYTFGPSISVDDQVQIEYSISSVTQSLGALQAAGFSTFAGGQVAQPAWSYLQTAHPDEALGYSGICYVAVSSYLLGGAAGLPQLSFEVDAALQVSEDNPDANPASIVHSVLTNPLNAVNFPADKLDLDQYSAWCVARGLYVSPVWAERKGVFEYIDQLCRITHARPLWSVDRFTIVPLATESLAGVDGSFAPLPEHAGPVYAINDEDIKGYVEEMLPGPRDRFNRVSVRFRNRDREYAEEVVDAEDRARIDAFGLIPDPEVRDAVEVAVPAIAATVAELVLRETVSEGAQYKFTLPIVYDLLEPLDIIQIEDARIALAPRAVRILEIEESGDDGELAILAEEVRTTGAVVQPRQVSGGYVYSNDPPAAVTIRAVLMPTAATGNQQQLWIGVAAGANWGGASVWVSATGLDYVRVGEVTARARLGTLAAGLASASAELNAGQLLDVYLSGATTLPTYSQLDVDAYRSLVWVNGELMAYRDGVLVGVGRYEQRYLRRQLYGTSSPAHSAGEPWMLLDGAVVKLNISPEQLGTTLYIKVTSRNALGSYVQGLEEVSAYPVILSANPSVPEAVSGLALTSPWVSNYLELNWAAAVRANDYEVQIVGPGSVLKRTVYTSATVCRYTYSDAVDDGGAERNYTVRVRGRNAGGNGPFADLAISNPAPAATTGVGATGSGTSRTISWTASAASDLAGYVARFSATSGFDPNTGAGTAFYDGAATSANLTGLTVGVTYYVRVAAYDVWDKDLADLTFSAQYSFTA